MIVSFCPGRVRFRFEQLKDAATAAAAQARIQETAGITRVAINVRTGSLLIEYDPLLLPTERLIALGKNALAQFGISLEI